MEGVHANLKSSNLHFLHTSVLLTISSIRVNISPDRTTHNINAGRQAKQKGPKMILTESNLLNQKESESITSPPLSPSMAQFMSDRGHVLPKELKRHLTGKIHA